MRLHCSTWSLLFLPETVVLVVRNLVLVIVWALLVRELLGVVRRPRPTP
jgi:hypothetical protein